MATKPKKSSSSSSTKVTRIKAADTSPVESKPDAKPNKPTADTDSKSGRSPLRAIADYFGGAWYELKQVHWPSRKATWGLTLALIIFTAVFVAIILLLDGLFQYLFKLLIG